MGFRKKTLSDGTYLISKDGVNEHLNHVHMAPDGTVLAWKVEGEHIINRREMRQAIKDLTGIEMNPRWEPK